jgi:hypothetical protein
MRLIRNIFFAGLVVAAGVAIGQQAADKQKQDKQSSDDDGQPLFQKPVTTKGPSKSTKESATLAFNGIDPNTGKPLGLTKTPTAADSAAAKKMSGRIPKQEVLMAFVKEGGLIAR